MNSLIRQHHSKLKNICRSLSVAKLYIFGSGADNSLHEESDLDFLVNFKNNLTAEEYADNYFLLHKKLSNLFNREIDLVTERSLSNPFFSDSINSTKKLIFDEKHQEISV